MRDVKGLVKGVYRVSEISALYLLLFIAGGFALRRRAFLPTLGRLLRWSGGIILGLVLLVGLGSLVGFDRLFLAFHLISFSNDLWQLDPRRDYLIAMFPQGFFLDATLLIAFAIHRPVRRARRSADLPDEASPGRPPLNRIEIRPDSTLRKYESLAMEFQRCTTKHERTYGARVSDDWAFRGLKTAVIENEVLRVVVLIDKGADIYQLVHKPTDTDFMWRSPWGVRDPRRFTPTTGSPPNVWLDYYEGGWQTVLARRRVPVRLRLWPTWDSMPRST